MGVSFSRKQENPPAKVQAELAACERKNNRTDRSQIPSQATLARALIYRGGGKVNLDNLQAGTGIFGATEIAASILHDLRRQS
jgi:hypothetical protein